MTARKVGVLLSYVLMIFEVFSTLLLTPYILRTLGQAEYGVYKLSVAITAYLLLLDLGVGNAIIRYISKFRVNNDITNAEKFLGFAILFYGAVSLMSFVLGICLILLFPTLFSNGLSADEILLGQKLLFGTTLNVVVTLATSAYSNTLIAYERFATSRGASIIQIIFRVLLFYICLKAGWGSLGLVYAQLFATIILRLFFVYYVTIKLKLKPAFKNYEQRFVKEIAIYSVLILLQMLATQINASLGQFLIGAIVSSSATILGVYSVGLQVVQYYQSIGSAFSSVMMPGLVKLVETKSSSDKICLEMIRIGRLIFMVLAIIWGTYIVCGSDFIVLWAGYDNSSAWLVSLILMTAYMFVLTESVGSQILWAKNIQKELSYAKLFVVLINVVLSVLLIKRTPLIGAAVATAIALFVGDIVVMNIIFIKKMHVNIIYYYKGLFKGIVPALLLGVSCGLIVNTILGVSWASLVIKTIAVVIPFLLYMIFWGFSSYEKQLLCYPIMRFFIKVYRYDNNFNGE